MAAANGAMVAVVDDDEAVRDSMEFLLQVSGYAVATFDSAAAFLGRPGGHAIAAIVMDHHMPGLTGLQLAAQLRAAGNRVPILLITGSPSPDIVARAAELGIEKVLEKPPSDGELLSFVAAHLP